ncbi:uncharacterized protein TNCT_329541 [Trichonephila clavata]|uniref:Uncharacterized protein n=1 Tax=Trichonephila clavata TaxID=2740835 RepID=A0A8X6IP73_TRICU|nr:uncharacterized protein TNCT_329541 [Trichonephila clavata]
MSFLGKGKKADLIKLANELDESESNGEDLKIIELRAKILASNAYKKDPEFVKDIFEGIVSDRKDEERERKEQKLRELELQKIRLQNETQRVKTKLAMSLADGQQTTGEVLTAQVMIEIEGRSVLTRFIILSKAKGNRTLLGTDFLSSAGLVLDMKNACWYFWDNPTHKYPLDEELDTPRP